VARRPPRHLLYGKLTCAPRSLAWAEKSRLWGPLASIRAFVYGYQLHIIRRHKKDQLDFLRPGAVQLLQSSLRFLLLLPGRHPQRELLRRGRGMQSPLRLLQTPMPIVMKDPSPPAIWILSTSNSIYFLEKMNLDVDIWSNFGCIHNSIFGTYLLINQIKYFLLHWHYLVELLNEKKCNTNVSIFSSLPMWLNQKLITRLSVLLGMPFPVSIIFYFSLLISISMI
jgi:hypothetical protein